MEITFYSNFMNHHQLPLAQELYSIVGDNYKFIATEPINDERLNLGYKDMNKNYPFILNTYENIEQEEYAKRLSRESDIVIIGSAPEKYVIERIKKNKITFHYSERLYKEQHGFITKLRKCKRFFSIRRIHRVYRNKPVYMLCASAYTARDFSLSGAYLGKCYKWGYFPEVKRYDIENLMEQKKHDIPFILWVGRLIDWKHPEIAILLAEHFKATGYYFEVNIIGNGKMEANLKQMIQDKNLNDRVHLLGSMSPEQVREHMKKANIFLFTSDFNEGWGAVLNESMNSGCAVVASHAIGSVPFLIKNGENGYIYKNGDLDDLYKKVRYLIDHPELQRTFGINSYNTLFNTWNPEVVAKRFITLVKNIQEHGECNLFEDGPCSKAEILKNNWFRDE